jgi:hypothetical protein
MDPTYTDRLETIVAQLPEESCAVGLIVAPDADWTLAAAGDLAATVSRARPGHTILVSLASGRPDLDHELGVESELGLSDVLTGATSLKSVAARSRGRGYIYVPQGASPLSARRVLESRAWKRIRDSALARGATLLVLLDSDSRRFDLELAGLVLLGVPDETAPREDGSHHPPVFGALHPPAATVPLDSVSGGEDPAAGVAASTISGAGRPASTRWSRRPRSARSSTMPSLRRRGSSKRRKDEGVAERDSTRRLQSPVLAVFIIAALLAVIALVVAAATGAGDRMPFLEQNDSLWQSPVPSVPSGESGRTRPDSITP